MKAVSKIDRYVIAQVKRRRKALGLSQDALATELDVAQSYIAAVESDEYTTRYSLERLNEIAKVLKCRLHDLLPEQPV